MTFLDHYFNSFCIEGSRAIYLELLLLKLHDLPNLNNFKLAQFSHGPHHWHTDIILNIIGHLNGKCCPRLRHLEFRPLVKTVADLIALLLPHTGALDKFPFNGELACSSITATAQEYIERIYVEGWIRAEISHLRFAIFEIRKFGRQPEHWPYLTDVNKIFMRQQMQSDWAIVGEILWWLVLRKIAGNLSVKYI